MAHILKKKDLSVVRTLNDIPDNSVDYIYSFNVLEHIADDLAILQQLYKKLRYGGRLLIYVPAFQLLYSSMDRKIVHFRRYTQRELKDKLIKAGFNVYRAGYVDSLGFLATLLFKLT